MTRDSLSVEISKKFYPLYCKTFLTISLDAVLIHLPSM